MSNRSRRRLIAGSILATAAAKSFARAGMALADIEVFDDGHTIIDGFSANNQLTRMLGTQNDSATAVGSGSAGSTITTKDDTLTGKSDIVYAQGVYSSAAKPTPPVARRLPLTAKRRWR